jgi:hypothetical protein
MSQYSTHRALKNFTIVFSIFDMLELSLFTYLSILDLGFKSYAHIGPGLAESIYRLDCGLDTLEFVFDSR